MGGALYSMMALQPRDRLSKLCRDPHPPRGTSSFGTDSLDDGSSKPGNRINVKLTRGSAFLLVQCDDRRPMTDLAVRPIRQHSLLTFLHPSPALNACLSQLLRSRLSES